MTNMSPNRKQSLADICISARNKCTTSGTTKRTVRYGLRRTAHYENVPFKSRTRPRTIQVRFGNNRTVRVHSEFGPRPVRLSYGINTGSLNAKLGTGSFQVQSKNGAVRV